MFAGSVETFHNKANFHVCRKNAVKIKEDRFKIEQERLEQEGEKQETLLRYERTGVNRKQHNTETGSNK